MSEKALIDLITLIALRIDRVQLEGKPSKELMEMESDVLNCLKKFRAIITNRIEQLNKVGERYEEYSAGTYELTAMLREFEKIFGVIK